MNTHEALLLRREEVISNHDEVICIRKKKNEEDRWKARLMEAGQGNRNRQST